MNKIKKKNIEKSQEPELLAFSMLQINWVKGYLKLKPINNPCKT